MRDLISTRDGATYFELLRNGKGLLLDFDARPALQTFARGWSDRITYVACDANERLGVSAVLVRPDGFVAWACDGKPNVDEAPHAAVRWFGERIASVGTINDSNCSFNAYELPRSTDDRLPPSVCVSP